MERQKREIKTPTGTSFEIYEYVTGRDIRAISEIAEKGDKGKTIDKMVELGVFSVSGSSENVLEKILDLQAKDYTFVITEVSRLFDMSEKKTEE